MQEIVATVSELLPGGTIFFQTCGDLTFLELSRRLNRQGSPPSPTALAAVFKRTKADHGSEAAVSLAAELTNGRPLLAANHHGFDTHPEMVQAVLTMDLARRFSEAERRPGKGPPVGVLACGLVPLRSPTCPGGFVLGRRAFPEGRRIRVLAFPRAWDEAMTAWMPPLSRGQTDVFRARLQKEPFRPEESRSAQAILDQAIEADFFDRPSFVSQAASVNRRLWASVTGGSDGGREVLHLELEAVVGDCLAADLEREDSSIRRTLLEEDVRRRVLCALAGRRGCWSPQLLGESLSSAALKDSSQALGTAFFWEIGESGRRHPMRIESGGGEAVLAGPGLRLSLRPDAVRSALRSGRIGPSLFLDYLTLADHNLETRAGVFALSYLPGLLEPMADILERPDLRAYARRSAWLAAGALPVRAVNREVEPLWQSEAAAGALELFAGEPWTMDRWRRLAELRLKDVWPFTASEWYLEETRPERRIRRWAAVLENMRSLGKGLTLPG